MTKFYAMKKRILNFFGVFPAVLMLAFACKQEAKPDDAVRNFYDAVAHKNFDEVAKLCTAESTKSIADIKTATDIQNKSVEEQVENLKKLKYSNVRVKGDSAFVDVTNDKITIPMVYTLVKKDGVWFVDLSPASMKRMVKKQ